MLPEFRAELIQHLVTIFLALLSGGIGASAINWWAGRKKAAAEAIHEEAQADKAHAEAELTRVEAAMRLLDGYEKDKAQMLIRMDGVEQDNKALKEQVKFLTNENLEREREIGRQNTVIEAYESTLNNIKAAYATLMDLYESVTERLAEITAELEKYKRMVVRLFEWIRAQGLEPPTLEELEGE